MANELFHFYGLQAILTDIGIQCIEANTIASASQAVDDFYEDKLITFENGELFYPIITAHKMLDSKNLDSRDASNIWMPFHFFPNNEGVCQPDTENVHKLIEFVKNYPLQNDVEKYLLHGILLHIYVDTYTHQGFMGLHCKHNDISNLDDKDSLDIGWLTGNLPPCIGHGEALTYPDDMWRRWSYNDNKNCPMYRDNQDIFIQIVKKIQPLMGILGYQVNELSNLQLDAYKKIFNIKGDNLEYRDKIINKFNRITINNVGDDRNIDYQKWKNNIMRKVQSKENKYIRITSSDFSFNESKWFLFQKIAKDVRTFFKSKIFPEIRITTTIY